MDTNEKDTQKSVDINSNDQKNPKQIAPKKQWDERPGERDSDPIAQQKNREWEEAQKKQQKNAENRGVGGSDSNQSENQRNQDPTNRTEDRQVEE